MNINSFLVKCLQQAIAKLYEVDLAEENLSLQPTRKEFEGSHTFVTFPHAKACQRNPQQLAEELGQFLQSEHHQIASYQVVKGFLNLSLSDALWGDQFSTICGDESWGILPKNGKKAVIEISSPNTNKPLHLGHLRNNFLGFSTSYILEAAGYDVRKVCIVNDRGIHICKSMVAYQHFGGDSTPESTNQKGDHFVGDYYVKFDQVYKQQITNLINEGADEKEAKQQAPILLEAQEMLKKWELQDAETMALWQKMNNWVYQGFEATYNTMEVGFDKVYYESNTYILGKDMVQQGLESGTFFSKEDGSVWIDLSAQGLDQKIILRSDGTSVYMTQDLGTAELRYQDFTFDKSIYVVGNEQDYHFKVLFEILKQLGRPYADGMFHLSYGMVDLPSGKMKSREGTVVDADHIMEEMVQTAQQTTQELGKIEGLDKEEAEELYRMLGLGALKYFLTKVDPKKRILFNPEESISFQGDTGPFVQYTHARIASILRRAQASGITPSKSAKVAELHETERSLIYLLNEFPQRIASAAEEYAPSIIAQYVYELAKEYNRFYAEVSIFNEDSTVTVEFRVQISAQVAKTIRLGMALLGIKVPERM